jgi:hypothetical protein
MKSSYKKAMIALGLMAAVLLFYNYSTVTEGLENNDEFKKLNNKFIADIKKILDKKRKILNRQIFAHLQKNPDDEKIKNLKSNVDEVFTGYKAKDMTKLNNLYNAVKEIPANVTNIKETSQYISQKFSMMNQLKHT